MQTKEHEIYISVDDKKHFTESESKDLLLLLGNELVQRYFKILYFNSIVDVARIDVNSTEGQVEAINKLRQLQGVQMICNTITGSFGPKTGGGV